MVPIPALLWQRAITWDSRSMARLVARLGEADHKVRNHVVTALGDRPEPLPPRAIADAVELPVAEVVQILDRLERRKYFLFRNGAGEVTWAYPVTADATPHHLAFASGERMTAA